MKPVFRNILTPILWHGAKLRYALERPTVIAVTGSVGKTSTKEAVAAVLAASGRPVIKTVGNLNTNTGVPLSLLGFSTYPRGLAGWLRVAFRVLVPPRMHGARPFYVLEFGTDKPGDIAFLAAKLPLDVAILTSIVPAHAEFFPRFEDYVAEKRSLLDYLKPDGYAVLNLDDPNQADIVATACWYGFDVPRKPGKEAVLGKRLTMGKAGLAFTADFASARRMDTIGHHQSGSLHVQSHFLGKHQLSSLLIAAAVGFKEGIEPEKIRSALQSLTPEAGRGRLIEGRKDTTIIDDSYNASPEAVKAGLDMLRAYAGTRRVVTILGRMNELGEKAPEFHDDVARYAAGKADFLVFVGQYAKQCLKAAVKAGQDRSKCLAFDTTEHLVDKLDQFVERNDIVYVKGSQNGVRLERAVKALMLHPSEAASLLVRQGANWKS